MAHSAAAGSSLRCQTWARDLHAPRSCVLRVSAPRLEQVEPSPSDEVPVTRARYSAGAFAPPATTVLAKDTSRSTVASLRGVHHSPQVLAEEDSRQRRTPLTDQQLEDYCTSVLGSSSNVWSAAERNIPASTSYSELSVDGLVAKLKLSKHGALVALKELTRRVELEAVVRGLQELSKADQEVVIRRWIYQDFLDAVATAQKAKLALQFAKVAFPHVKKPVVLAMTVLKTCAKCRDLDAGMAVIELARKHAVAVDTHMLTTLIKVCKAVGNVDKAYRVYLDMRSAGHRIDSHVYGALIATCAEAMKRDLTVMHERKDQYVLLERAFQYVADAEAAGVALQAPVWNSLMVCAGRSGELNRAFEVLTMMQQRGIPASATTYGSLIESCVCAGQPEKALRVFEVATQKGFQGEVRIYTQALSACMLPLPHAWERAQDIYATLQRAAVRPDKKFFACLMAVAGRLDTSFELLTEMAAEGILPSATTVSAIIYACLERGNLALARRVYDLCARQGVYPVLSQFNRMMDVYASDFRFGEVVSLLSDMVAAGRSPNLNTYRIVINACTFTDQAGLAFQVFALMHANKVPILQQGVAQAIYYMLIKACLGQTRYLWVPTGYPPTGPSIAAPSGTAPLAAVSNGAPGTVPHQHMRGLPAERQKEAERVLAALGAHKLRRGAHQSNPFDGPPDTIDWASHALSAFHHMLSRGFRPTLELLDCLLNCMRAMLMPPEEPGSMEAAKQYVSPFVPLRSRNDVFEVAFEPRAFAVLDEAIAKGLVPSYDPEAPMVVDMRNMPPVVAEVYVLHVLLTVERRARRRQADVAEPAGSGSYHHSITLLVPPFDPDLVKWPSYTERLMNRYTAMMEPEERARLRQRSEYRRARARRRRRRIAAEKAAAAAAEAAAADDDVDSDSDSSFGPLGGVAGSSYDELEAVMSSVDDDANGASHDPWRREDEAMLAGWSTGSVGAAGSGAADGASVDQGSLYVADSSTGLAVAATLQRMKVWMDMDYVNGTITVFAVEVTRWLKRRRQAAEASAAAAVAAGVGVGTMGAVGSGASAGARGRGNDMAASGAASNGDGNGGLSPGAGLGSPAASRGAVGSAALGVMAGGLAGALTSARMMGITGPRSRGAAMEQQQRNIRLGMLGASGPSSSSGRGSGASSAAPHSHAAGAPVPSAGPADSTANATPGQTPQQPVGRGLFSGNNSGEAASSRSRSLSSGRAAPKPLAGSTKEQPRQKHVESAASHSRGSDAATNGHVTNGTNGYAAPFVHHGANGLNGRSNGNGDDLQHHAAEQQGLLVAMPQQHAEVSVGPGPPVKLSVTEAAAVIAAAAAQVTAAGAGLSA